MRVGTSLRLKDIYKANAIELNVHERTFRQWVSWGTNFAVVAGGGTIYVLILIAGLNLRVSLAHFDGATAVAIGNILRNPPDGRVPHSFKLSQLAYLIHAFRHFANSNQGPYRANYPSFESCVSSVYGHVDPSRRLVIPSFHCGIQLLRYQRIRFIL
jgi:hypothetical protein